MKPQPRIDGTRCFSRSLAQALALLGLLAGASLHADYLTSGCEDMLYPDGAHSALKLGQSLYSDNEKYVLTLQHDGNLVFRRNIEPYSVPIWQSGTSGAGKLWLMGDPDNNFTLYSQLPGSEKKALWSTGTAGQGEFQANLIIGDDGTLSVRSGDELLWLRTGLQQTDEGPSIKDKKTGWPAYLHPYGTGIPSPMPVEIRSAL